MKLNISNNFHILKIPKNYGTTVFLEKFSKSLRNLTTCLLFFFEEAKLTPFKLAPERIELEILRRSTLSGSKPIPLGQPKWVIS